MAERILRVDLTKVKAQLLAAVPHKPDVDRMLKGLGAATMHYWKSLAQKELRSTARDYIQALSHREEPGKVIVELRAEGGNPMPGMVEEGWAGGDMRDWMLKSPKAKQGKEGPYLVVPFRHGTPGTTGRNVGAVMPGPIHEAAKKLIPQLSRPGKPVSTQAGVTTVHGQRLHPGLPMRQAARKILERKEKPWHSTSIYMGMIRKAQPTKRGLQTSGYQTFRTISRHSSEPGKHWVHPGIKARHIADKVRKHIDTLANQIVEGATR
jgi:hypothetical protein